VLVAIAAWLVLLGTGWYLVRTREAPAWKKPPAGHWVAARRLPAMAQLDSADLDRPSDAGGKVLPPRSSLVGRHLAGEKQKGNPITAVDLHPLAIASPAGGRVRFVLAARAGEVPVLALASPGDLLSPCLRVGKPAGWSCSGAPFTIVALHRPSAARDSLWAVLDAASGEEAAAFMAAPTRILLRR
jgi:hypothetical protein